MAKRAKGSEGQPGGRAEKLPNENAAVLIPVVADQELALAGHRDPLGVVLAVVVALAVLFDLAGGDLGGLLSPVGDRDEFLRRLLDLGLRDASHAPLGEDR